MLVLSRLGSGNTFVQLTLDRLLSLPPRQILEIPESRMILENPKEFERKSKGINRQSKGKQKAIKRKS